VHALAESAGRTSVVAVVRDPSSEKAQAAFGKLSGVEVVAGDMGAPESLEAGLAGATRAFIVVPGHHERTQLALNALDAVKRAGVRSVLMLSVCTAEREDTIFGSQFAPIEAAVKASGLDYTIMRLPMFMDNNYGHAASVKGQKALYGPVPAAMTHNPIAVADVGAAAAALLTKPRSFRNRTVTISTPPTAFGDELAAAMSAAVGTDVSYVEVPYEAAKEAFMGMGMPEWQVDGILELFKSIAAGEPELNVPGNFLEIVGRDPMTLREWVAANAAAFKGE